MAIQDHFSRTAAVYARARPEYPAAFLDHIARLSPSHQLAWDCGTGSGQAAVGLADRFDRVVATDPSARQLSEAAPHARIQYVLADERVPSLADGSVGLVTAASAAHWFDRPKFYAEVRRVAQPRAIVALWIYLIPGVSPEVDAVVNHFNTITLEGYWPAGRQQAAEGYQGMSFPFKELPFPEFSFPLPWTVEDYLAFMQTWSAVACYQKAQAGDPVAAVAPTLREAWGPGRRETLWPLRGRIGLVA